MNAGAGKVLLLGVSAESTAAIYWALAREFNVVAAVLETPISRAGLLVRRAKRLGIAAAASQAIFVTLVAPLLRTAARGRIAELRAGVGEGRAIPSGAVRTVSSANDDACISVLRGLAPDVVVVHGTRILSERVLGSTPAVFLNMHAGITPRYRGVHGAYWALAEGRPDLAGVTIHRVDKGIDTGGIIAQARVDLGPDDTFATFPFLQLRSGLPLLVDAVRAALSGTLIEVPSLDPSLSQLRYHPGVIEYFAAWAKVGVR